jgi:hypothetical protein
MLAGLGLLYIGVRLRIFLGQRGAGRRRTIDFVGVSAAQVGRRSRVPCSGSFASGSADLRGDAGLLSCPHSRGRSPVVATLLERDDALGLTHPQKGVPSLGYKLVRCGR